KAGGLPSRISFGVRRLSSISRKSCARTHRNNSHSLGSPKPFAPPSRLKAERGWGRTEYGIAYSAACSRIRENSALSSGLNCLEQTRILTNLATCCAVVLAALLILSDDAGNRPRICRGSTMKRILIWLAWAILTASMAAAGEVGFVEDFALAK